MSLPSAIIDHLQTDFVSESRPYCFLVDSDYGLIDYRLIDYGLIDL